MVDPPLVSGVSFAQCPPWGGGGGGLSAGSFPVDLIVCALDVSV